MAQIPGTTIFASSARNYGNDVSQSVSFSLLPSATSLYYKPGNARSVQIIAKGSIDVLMKNAASTTRVININGAYTPAGGTNTGILSGDIIPHEFAVKNTGGSNNPITLNINY